MVFLVLITALLHSDKHDLSFTAYFVLENNLPLRSELETKRMIRTEITNTTFGTNYLHLTAVLCVWASWDNWATPRVNDTSVFESVHLSSCLCVCACIFLSSPRLQLIFLHVFSQGCLWSSSILLTSLTPTSTAFFLLCKPSPLYYICIFYFFILSQHCELQRPDSVRTAKNETAV